MTTSTSPRCRPHLEVDEVEKDLWRWLDILTDDSDLLVVLGLVAARIVDASVLDGIPINEPSAKAFDLAEHGISARTFLNFRNCGILSVVVTMRRGSGWLVDPRSQSPMMVRAGIIRRSTEPG
jgi:hypothetical protein